MSEIALLILIGAAVFGCRGWLVNRPTDAGRLRDRFAACGCGLVATCFWFMEAWNRHSWLWLATCAVGLLIWLGKAQHWWRIWESQRQIDRARHPRTERR